MLFIVLLFNILVHISYSSNNNKNSSGNDRIPIEESNYRKLQFEGMFELNNNPQQRFNNRGNKRKRMPGGRGGGMYNSNGGSAGKAGGKSRANMLSKHVDDIIVNADRYHQWWTGPIQSLDLDESHMFSPAPWAEPAHTNTADAIFTMAVIQGKNDTAHCSSPHDLILYLGTARKFHKGDIVLALEADVLTDEIKMILAHYRVIVYVLPQDLCSKATDSIFCGSEEERVPASVFRYYFFEKWAALYSQESLILITDFRDILFQGDPFAYHRHEWRPDFQLAVFQEFHPNMVVNRCRFNRRIMEECFGESALRMLGNRIIISSGALIGTRDGLIVWAHHMTMQLQDAPGRLVETSRRCVSGGIDHSFINYLVYGNKLRQYVRIRIFSHGEGAVNSLGGLRPDTVAANITGNVGSFWGVLNKQGYILNWNGEIAPVVHQLDHFLDELTSLTDAYAHKSADTATTAGFSSALSHRYKPEALKRTYRGSSYVDRAWQALAVSQCLFDCTDSIDFSKISAPTAPQ